MKNSACKYACLIYGPLRTGASVLFLITVLCIAVLFSGCTVSFIQNDTLQLSLSKPTNEAAELLSEFEAGEADNFSGDMTQKTGSVCAGGACIIY